MSANRVYLHGRLGKDPELKMTPGGKALVKFSLATKEQWKDSNGEKKEKTEWHNCYAWAKLAEMIDKHFRKGQEAIIHGKIEYSETKKDDGSRSFFTNIRVNDIEFCGGKNDGGNSRTSAPDPDENEMPPHAGSSAPSYGDEDIPF